MSIADKLREALMIEEAILDRLHPMDYWDAHTAQEIRVDALKRAIELAERHERQQRSIENLCADLLDRKSVGYPRLEAMRLVGKIK